MTKRLPKRSKYRKQQKPCRCALCTDRPRWNYALTPDEIAEIEAAADGPATIVLARVGPSSAAELLRCREP